MLVMLGTVQEELPIGSLAMPPQLNALIDGLKGPAQVGQTPLHSIADGVSELQDDLFDPSPETFSVPKTPRKKLFPLPPIGKA